MPSAARIRDVSCLLLRLPFEHGGAPPLFAGRPRTTLDSALIRVETQGGLVGWGEAYGADLDALRSIVAHRVAPLAAGREADDVGLLPDMARALHLMGRSGPVVHALSGLDIALWDLRGKLAGLPLATLLGGARRDRIDGYASLLQYYGDADAIARNVERALEDGYRSVKLHERTSGAVAVARRVAGRAVPLMVDVNCAWSLDEASQAIAAMAADAPAWIEEPIWPPEDHVALAALRRTCGIPLAAGENASSEGELIAAVTGSVLDFVQPSAIKSGGVTTLARLSRCCAGSPVRLAPHSAYFGPGFLATLHVLAAHATPEPVERIYCELAMDPYGGRLRAAPGAFALPDGPGLGLDPDPALLASACIN